MVTQSERLADPRRGRGRYLYLFWRFSLSGVALNHQDNSYVSYSPTHIVF